MVVESCGCSIGQDYEIICQLDSQLHPLLQSVIEEGNSSRNILLPILFQRKTARGSTIVLVVPQEGPKR